MKNSVSLLKQLIHESIKSGRLLKEEEKDDETANAPTDNQEQQSAEPGDSIDSQIDRLLIQYEKDALEGGSNIVDHRDMTRNFFSSMIHEADEDQASQEEKPSEFDARKFATDIESEHGITVGKSDIDKAYDIIPPAQRGAGPEGGG
jgi:hypothetical protein